MPVYSIGGTCCICPTPLGSVDCESMKVGLQEAYYTCPTNISAIGYLPDAGGCTDKGEINAFGLAGALPEQLLQPINFVVKDDNSGAVWTFEETAADGNVVLNHTFVFQVNTSTPTEEAALCQMLGREVAIITKDKNGVWRMINHAGGMKVASNTGGSSQGYTEVTISGQVNEKPLRISYSDGGAWADANLVPFTIGGLINA